MYQIPFTLDLMVYRNLRLSLILIVDVRMDEKIPGFHRHYVRELGE